MTDLLVRPRHNDSVVRFVVDSPKDTKFQILWNLVGCGIAAVFLIIGGGYAVGGKSATNSPTLELLYLMERPIGGYYAHGTIMVSLAVSFAFVMGNYPRATRFILQMITLYSVWTALMIFGGWIFYPVSFGAPWWYLFVTFLSIVLLVTSRRPRQRDGGGGRA